MQADLAQLVPALQGGRSTRPTAPPAGATETTVRLQEAITQVIRLLASAERAVAQGYRRVGLVSAAVSDHTQIDELATQLQAMGVAISASSMRMDPISVPLIRAMAASGAQTLTVAPGPRNYQVRSTTNTDPAKGPSLSRVSRVSISELALVRCGEKPSQV